MNRVYTLPGVIAIALALLFPIYWVTALGFSELSFIEAFRADVTSFGALDVLFVLIGAMEIYVYLSLRRILLEQLHGTLPATLLLLMAIIVGVFHATVVFDVVLAFGPSLEESTREHLITASAIVAISGLFASAVLAFMLSISLLVGKAEIPGLLKAFAILLMVCCLLQLTIVLGVFNVILFPVALLVLAVFFIRGGHEVEVV